MPRKERKGTEESMIRIETIEIAGFAACLTAVHLPFTNEIKSEVHADYGFDEQYHVWTRSDVEICEKDVALLSRLVRNGDEHAKAIRGIQVYALIEAPVYWWCELETYCVGHYRLASESTMHKDCRGLTGEELVKAKSEIPMGKMLRKADAFNYQNLRNIYRQRKNHRLPEWHQFCEWIESLPYAKELILTGLDV